MSFFRDQLEDWLKQIPVEGGKVVDIGGAQLPVRGRTMSWNPASYVIWDLPQPHEEKERATYGMDIQDPKAVDPTVHQFDIAFCLETAEYWWDPVTALKNIARALRPGGTLYISFPQVYPAHKPIGCDFLRYTEEGARKLLEVAGFEIKEVRPRKARMPQALIAFYSSDGMHPRRDDTIAHTGSLIIANKP